MKKFNNRIGAAVLIALAAAYAAGSTMTGQSAKSEIPPDWSSMASEAGVDVWQTVAMMSDVEGALLIDVRDEHEREQFALAGAFAMPGASAKQLAEKSGYGRIIIIAPTDEVAQKLAGEAKTLRPRGEYHFLRGGARSWYLAFELPVGLFSTTPPPHGYLESRAVAKRFVLTGLPTLREDAREAAITLSRLSYTPDLLGQTSKPKAAAGGRKKISGGCGG